MKLDRSYGVAVKSAGLPDIMRTSARRSQLSGISLASKTMRLVHAIQVGTEFVLKPPERSGLHALTNNIEKERAVGSRKTSVRTRRRA